MAKMTDTELLAEAKERYDASFEYWQPKYERANFALKFLEGFNHWEAQEQARRIKRGRPCLVMKSLNKYTKQVVGEMLRNKVKIKVRLDNSEGDYETAKVIEGKICDVQYRANFDSIYDYCSNSLVESGFAAFRVLTINDARNPFLKDVTIKRIENFNNVIIDHTSSDPNFRDVEYQFLTEKMKIKTFERLYPNIPVPTKSSGFENLAEYWIEDDELTITEYFYKEYYDEEKVLLSDGQVMEPDEAKEYVENMQAQFDASYVKNPSETDMSKMVKIVEKKSVEKYNIKWIKMTGFEILEKSDWPSKYMSIIFVTGEERNIEGEKYYRGLIHDGIDAAKLADYWHTASAELVALAPKARYWLTPKQIAGNENQLKNNDNLPYFLFTPDPDVPGRPQLEQPAQPPMAILSQSSAAEEQIKSSIGMYNADLGDSGRELSGDAIEARRLPGQISTYTYHNTMNDAVSYCGKIIYDVFTNIADTEREERIRGGDDSEMFAPVNTTARNAKELIEKDPVKYAAVDKEKLQEIINKDGEDADYNNLSKGEYDIYITTGASFETQRMENVDKLLKLSEIVANAQSPQSLVTAYYIADSMDFERAREFADALRKFIPYGILPPKPGEKPPEPQPPTPEQKMQADILMMERRNQEQKGRVEEQRLVTEEMKQKRMILESNIDLQKAELEKNTTVAETMSNINKNRRQ